MLEVLLAARGGGGLQRGAAGAGLGRQRRPVHHHRAGHHHDAAQKLGDPPLIETVVGAGYRIAGRPHDRHDATPRPAASARPCGCG